MNFTEWILSGLLIVGIIFVIYYIFRAKLETENAEKDILSLQFLCHEVRDVMNEIINMDVDLLNLNQKDLENRKALKRSLSEAIRKCSQGDLVSKMIVFARIKSTLSNVLNISEEVIDEVICFNDPNRLTPTDKFEILMYLQKREQSINMFRDICKITGLDELKKDEAGYYYQISAKDIERVYEQLARPLSYDDKLNVLTQKIYQDTYGLSVTDLFIMEDESIDGIEGGVSGVTKDDFRYEEEDVFNGTYQRAKTYESIWIVYAGKQIHMSFLSFKTNAEIIRVCKNLSEHGRMGHMTSMEGGLKTHLADGSRVTVFRPNNSTQWAFFVRKFGTTNSYSLNELITDKGCEYPIGILKWGTKGCLNMIFSGDQNSGKTSNMRGVVKETDRRQTIRTLEADFELYLNDAYHEKNILGSRPSERMSFPKMIELLKASDAHTILFGETASLEHARHLIDLLLAGTKKVLTTGHWPTTDEMISYFVHSMGAYGTAGANEVEAMVARLLHLDVHHVKENDGHRHIDRITEIIPYSRKDTEREAIKGKEGTLYEVSYYLKQLVRSKTYYTKDLVIYEDGEYQFIHPISEELAEILMKNLPPEEREAFIAFNSQAGGEKKVC